MGADKDLEVMSEAAKVFDDFGIAYDMRIVSVHRTPDVAREYALKAADRGIKVIIAGAGGSAHLPGMTAAYSLLPVLAVPVKPDHHDHEALWSSIKMPTGIPLATLPENNAHNAALMAIEILSLSDEKIAKKYLAFRESLRAGVRKTDEKLSSQGWQKYLGKK